MAKFLFFLLIIFLTQIVCAQSDMEKFIQSIEYSTKTQFEDLLVKQKSIIANSKEKGLVVQVRQSEFNQNFLARIEVLMKLADESTPFDFYTKAWANYHLASTLTSYDLVKEGQFYTQKAIFYATKANAVTIMFYSYQNLAGSYYRIKQYAKAFDTYKKCIDFKNKVEDFQIASTFNNMALCQFHLTNFKKTEQLYQHGLNLVRSSSGKMDVEVYYLIVGNLGTLHHTLGQTKQALKELEQEYNYHVINKYFDANYMSCVSELHEICHQQNQVYAQYYQDFEEYLQLPITIKEKTATIRAFLNRNLNYLNENQKLKILNLGFVSSLQNDSVVRKDQGDILSLLYSDKLESMKKEKLQIQKQMELESKNNLIKTILIVFFGMGLFISIYFIWKINKQKHTQNRQATLIQRQQNEIHITKQQLLENDLKAKQEELTLLNLNLRIKKETEENYLGLIRKFKRSSNISIDEVINELQLNIRNLNEIDRKMDVSSYSKTTKNSDFNAVLKDRFPSLTDNETAYCHYFLLNLSSKEIGQITGQTSGAVRVYKNKIKKKLGLEKENDLHLFLNSLNLKN